jgi:uncharacterized delta-60 repeat protein
VSRLTFGAHADAGGAVVDATDRINVVGWSEDGAPVARLTSDGQLDTTFANGGTLIESGRPSLGFTAVALQNASLVAVGSSTTSGISSAVTARYSPAGERDLTFGDMGFAEPLPLTGLTSRANGVAVQSDGRVVVVGGFGEPADYDMFVARYCP